MYMIYRAIFIMTVLVSFNQAFGDNLFHSLKGHYSLWIPSEWDHKPLNHLGNTDEFFVFTQRVDINKDIKDLRSSFVLLHSEICAVDEKEIEAKLSSEEAQEDVQKKRLERFRKVISFHGWTPTLWQEAQLLDYRSSYDTSSHRNTEKFILLNSDSMKMVIGVVTILGNQRITTLQYCHEFEDGNNSELKNIINSFGYDKQYGYRSKSLSYAESGEYDSALMQVKKRMSILVAVWIGTFSLIALRLCAWFIKKRQPHPSPWVRICLALWYPLFGAFILCIAVVCGYSKLWGDFGISLVVGALFFIRGYFCQFCRTDEIDTSSNASSIH